MFESVRSSKKTSQIAAWSISNSHRKKVAISCTIQSLQISELSTTLLLSNKFLKLRDLSDIYFVSGRKRVLVCQFFLHARADLVPRVSSTDIWRTPAHKVIVLDCAPLNHPISLRFHLIPQAWQISQVKIKSAFVKMNIYDRCRINQSQFDDRNQHVRDERLNNDRRTKRFSKDKHFFDQSASRMLNDQTIL
jgi:hypothetical protein